MTLTSRIPPVDVARRPAFRALIDAKAKPQGALGRLEDLAIDLALIQDRPDPRVGRALLLVFAGDHGLNQEGVSAYPSAVTAAMTATFLAGKASANAFARAVEADVRVVDAGVDADLAPHPTLIDAKVRRGTRNAAREAALTFDETRLALERGGAIAAQALDEGYEILIAGEMGIGNTASAALLLHRLAALPLEDCIGVGAGHDEAGLERKRAVLRRAAARIGARPPLETASEFGGLEIIMMAGAMLGAAARRAPTLVDGFISTAAALLATRLDPDVRPYLIFSHCSAERGHRAALDALGAEPLLSLGLRLGEGTGGLLALPLTRSAARLMSEVATLSEVLEGRL